MSTANTPQELARLARRYVDQIDILGVNDTDDERSHFAAQNGLDKGAQNALSEVLDIVVPNRRTA